ncbi:alkaline phosphatase family protein [Flavihumibacter fluvii]|uniref:alkaline phosphatase family protein n=1 Tax=Flavihumibacter fluvii TaxID=2838157 RepID=UPI001BDE9260|nr:alkaline phosphatase family protein [Flavihumibacter fluvii]ULQ53786.1 phosphoesterase [Flavihumibacter fluvii]
MKRHLLIGYLLISVSAFTQTQPAFVVNAHSHNDYEQLHPFESAYNEQFGSIEADVFLKDGQLLVAHEWNELNKNRTLKSLYLDKLSRKIAEHKGSVYADPKKSLQLLIDIKSASGPTLDTLVSLLRSYPAVINNPTIRIVISGNKPDEHLYSTYPSFILFDGRLGGEYSPQALDKIALLSDDFSQYSSWDGKGILPYADSLKIASLVGKAHGFKKPVRFWASPDSPNSWNQLIRLGVDYINTDRIGELSSFLQNPARYFYEEKLDNLSLHDDTVSLMPYNRIIRSAGSVIRFGDPNLENHALDVAALPGGKHVVVEDRYGIFILDLAQKKIFQRWSYSDQPGYQSYISTYSGIKVFNSGGKTWITWGASSHDSDAAVMLAEWTDSLKNISGIPVIKRDPASNALPNEVLVQNEGAETFLYVVLNGNDQLLKLRLRDKQIIWQSNTGMAPYGVTMANQKIYVTNWAGPRATDSTRERAGIPWGMVYTDPRTGATAAGTVSVIDPATGKLLKEISVGLHPNAIKAGRGGRFVYVSNGSDDKVSVINTRKDKVIENIGVGLIKGSKAYTGSTPNGLELSADNTNLYVSNGLDNAVAVVSLGKKSSVAGKGKSYIKGFIPTEAYPAGLVLVNNMLVVTNLESGGADVIQPSKNARSIHNQLGSVSLIPLPDNSQLETYTGQVFEMSLMGRVDAFQQPVRSGIAPVPVPARLGEPSTFKHVVYIIKENKTYDQVYGDLPAGRGDSSLCIFGNLITPNMHALAKQYGWMDNYYASGKSSAEGHQWTDAAMVSDYVEKNVRAWFRSYPHRQEDALVYNKSGFIWNQALDHGKSVRIFGEACKTIYDEKLGWSDIYSSYKAGHAPAWYNTSTIARIRPIISPYYPDCDNIAFNDQQRADEFIKEWKAYEAGDSLPNLMILSLPNDHSAGTSPGFPTPNAMVADNDLAVGRIVEAITTSKYWDSTVIFITQDDSQSGWDHISAYRTIGLVISPYSTGKLVTTNYNQTSMLRTIEQILGIPPMNIIDATAKPMFDCFGEVKKISRYTNLPNNIPLDEMNKGLNSLNGKARKFALQSLDEVFNEVDGGQDDKMNRILWFYAKGNQPYPLIRK